MAHIGRKLRELRLRSGLSLKDVEEHSAVLARDWGSDSYQISGSFLARVELGKHEMTVTCSRKYLPFESGVLS